MKINKLLLSAVLCTALVSSASCKKNKQTANTIMNSNTTLNLDSMLASYTTKPAYYVNYGNEDCLFELRVNDVVVDRMTSPGEIGGTAATINPYIMKSGKQKVSLKLYPNPGKTMIKSSGNQRYPYFKPFELEIDYVDFKLPDDEQTSVVVFTMPDIVTPEEGLPYYEFEGEFEAEVPYQIEGWDDCIDLREVPDIEQRVVDEFKRVRQLMVDKKYDEIKEYFAQRDLQLDIALYNSNESANQIWEKSQERISRGEGEEWQPIEDYRLEFEAQGRSVTLRSTKKKGFSSALLWIKQNKGESRYKFGYFELHLGIKKGTDKLVAIIA